jgi:ATP-dependent protease HslVU (ClpYQ) peptidase subunit
MVLEDAVDDMNMVENAQHDRRIVGVETVDIVGDRFIKTAVGPLLAPDEQLVGMGGHGEYPFASGAALRRVTVALEAAFRICDV